MVNVMQNYRESVVEKQTNKQVRSDCKWRFDFIFVGDLLLLLLLLLWLFSFRVLICIS